MQRLLKNQLSKVTYFKHILFFDDEVTYYFDGTLLLGAKS